MFQAVINKYKMALAEFQKQGNSTPSSTSSNTEEPSFQIFIKHDRTYTLDVKNNDTIETVLSAFLIKANIPLDADVYFNFLGKNLDESTTIADNKIAKESTVHFSVRGRGGGGGIDMKKAKKRLQTALDKIPLLVVSDVKEDTKNAVEARNADFETSFNLADDAIVSRGNLEEAIKQMETKVLNKVSGFEEGRPLYNAIAPICISLRNLMPHFSDGDFSGTIGDTMGISIIKDFSKGTKYFDHLDEFNNTLRGLMKQYGLLKALLQDNKKNPAILNLTTEVSAFIDSLSKLNRQLNNNKLKYPIIAGGILMDSILKSFSSDASGIVNVDNYYQGLLKHLATYREDFKTAQIQDIASILNYEGLIRHLNKLDSDYKTAVKNNVVVAQKTAAQAIISSIEICNDLGFFDSPPTESWDKKPLNFLVKKYCINNSLPVESLKKASFLDIEKLKVALGKDTDKVQAQLLDAIKLHKKGFQTYCDGVSKYLQDLLEIKTEFEHSSFKDKIFSKDYISAFDASPLGAIATPQDTSGSNNNCYIYSILGGLQNAGIQLPIPQGGSIDTLTGQIRALAQIRGLLNGVNLGDVDFIEHGTGNTSGEMVRQIIAEMIGANLQITVIYQQNGRYIYETIGTAGGQHVYLINKNNTHFEWLQILNLGNLTNWLTNTAINVNNL